MGRVHIHHEVTGSGPAVLLTHGFGRRRTCSPAPSPTCPPTTPSSSGTCAGTGAATRRPIRPPTRWPRRSTAMLAILDDVGVERAVLLGHSLGGYLSLELAIAHPERTAALVLVDTGPGYRNDAGRAGWNEMAERYARDLDERGLDGLPGSDELTAGVHRSAAGLALAAARRAAAVRRPRARGAADDRRADARRRRRARRRRSSVARGTWPTRSPAPRSPSSTAPATPRRSAIRQRSTPCCGPSSPACGIRRDDAGRGPRRGAGVARRALGPRRRPARLAAPARRQRLGHTRRGRASGTAAACPAGPTPSSPRSWPPPAPSARRSGRGWASPRRRCWPTAPTSSSAACCRGRSPARTRGASCSASRATAPTSPG